MSTEQTECIICKKPLGLESCDMGYLTCHDHRTCLVCERELTAREVKWCYDKLVDHGCTIDEIEIIHPRCLSLNHPTIEQDPTLSIKQSEYDYLNLCRLCITPNLDLSIVTNENNACIQTQRFISTMSFDEKLVHLKMLEACVAQVSIALRQDPSWRKDAYSEREKKHAKKAAEEKLTSSRPVSKPADDGAEIALATFMERHDIKERKVAEKLWRDRERSVASMKKAFDGMPEQQLRDMVTAEMTKSGLLKKIGEVKKC